MKISVISFTVGGHALAEKLKNLPGHIVECSTADNLPDMGGLHGWCETSFRDSDALIFIGACGIAVRSVAPFLVSKTVDPAVLVIDEKASNVISLLSGHIGGANELTLEIADFLGANPVITTASDVNKKLAIDVWAKKNGIVLEDMKLAKLIEADILKGKKIRVSAEQEIRGELPEELIDTKGISLLEDEEISEYEIHIAGHYTCAPMPDTVLNACKKQFVIGVGCKKDTDYEAIRSLVMGKLDEYKIKPEAVFAIVSIDIKADEEGIKKLADELGVPFITFSADELNAINIEGLKFSSSAFVQGITGVDCVCERAAVAGCLDTGFGDLIINKCSGEGVTCAVAVRLWEEFTL